MISLRETVSLADAEMKALRYIKLSGSTENGV